MRTNYTKLPEIEINEEESFDNGDAFGRTEEIINLTNFIQSVNSSNGHVLAINGGWGSGKTTFVRMWNRYLQGTPQISTFFVNVWENDFLEDPLVALVAQLKKEYKIPKARQTLSSLLCAGGKIAIKTGGAAIKAITKSKLGLDTAEVLSSTTDAFSTLMEKNIEEYENQSATIKEFRETLSKLKSEVSKDKPLVFFIDELDRCKPSYAVKVLECIKHLFNVPGIIFVLSIDREQLANAVKGYYGSDMIDGNEYLRRFIDIEYSLSRPKVGEMCKYIFDKLKMGDHIMCNKSQRRQMHDDETFLECARLFTSKKNLNIRQLEKLFAHASLAIQTFSVTQIIRGEIIFILTYLNMFEHDFYEKIKSEIFSISEFISELSRVIPDSWCESDDRIPSYGYLRYYIAELIHIYNTKPLGQSKEELLSDTNPPELLIDNMEYDKSELKNSLKDVRKYEFYAGRPSISDYVRHIEFADSFK